MSTPRKRKPDNHLWVYPNIDIVEGNTYDFGNFPIKRRQVQCKKRSSKPRRKTTGDQMINEQRPSNIVEETDLPAPEARHEELGKVKKLLILILIYFMYF